VQEEQESSSQEEECAKIGDKLFQDGEASKINAKTLREYAKDMDSELL